jgi:hypothetical protein
MATIQDYAVRRMIPMPCSACYRIVVIPLVSPNPTHGAQPEKWRLNRERAALKDGDSLPVKKQLAANAERFGRGADLPQQLPDWRR